MKIINRRAAQAIERMDDLMNRIETLKENPDPEAEALLIRDIRTLTREIDQQIIESSEDFAPSSGRFDLLQ